MYACSADQHREVEEFGQCLVVARVEEGHVEQGSATVIDHRGQEWLSLSRFNREETAGCSLRAPDDRDTVIDEWTPDATARGDDVNT